jgi:hypothetical protein
MPSQGARTAMLLGGALVASLASATTANAQGLASTTQIGSGVSFVDLAGDQSIVKQPTLDLSMSADGEARFSNFTNFSEPSEAIDRRSLEVELAAGHDLTGIPFDLSFAQRASFGAGADGEIDRHSRGSEVRIGRAFGDPDGGMTTSESRVYIFAASDNEAVHWRPGQELTNFSLVRDTVQVGDMQAGVTYQRGRIQASVAYVEREISTRVGRESFSDQEQFAGFTLTMKH